ncbi:tyrosine-type recombinase/integrase [Candidatus Amarolinea dominans]|uniref:tyrosine-type recombinase/integrase n=1 Tax=Candidatus Amarolinea dominans TaxID=3140696 RepID=UPI0031CC52C5
MPLAAAVADLPADRQRPLVEPDRPPHLAQSPNRHCPGYRACSPRRGDHIQEGRLSDRAIALVVKRCAQAAGLDPDQYSEHSLRAGFATTAGEKGVEERDIQRQTGHKSVQVLRGYIRHGSLFKRNAAAQVGL